MKPDISSAIGVLIQSKLRNWNLHVRILSVTLLIAFPARLADYSMYCLAFKITFKLGKTSTSFFSTNITDQLYIE